MGRGEDWERERMGREGMAGPHISEHGYAYGWLVGVEFNAPLDTI